MSNEWKVEGYRYGTLDLPFEVDPEFILSPERYGNFLYEQIARWRAQGGYFQYKAILGIDLELEQKRIEAIRDAVITLFTKEGNEDV